MKQYIVAGALLLLIVSTMIFLFTQSDAEKSVIIVKAVDIKGCNMLSEDDYLAFVSMTLFPTQEKISLAVIKDRFHKHPYVQSARIEVHSDNSLTVHLIEKNIVANILIDNEIYFYSIDRQVIPHLKNTRSVDFPLIMSDEVSKPAMNKIIKNQSLENSLKIIFAAKNYSDDLYQKISQIFTEREKLKISLSHIDSEIYFDPDKIPSNVIALTKLIERFRENPELDQNFIKIDFRFADHIFLTKKEVIGI